MAAQPFLKWAGGKRQLLLELRKHVPAKFNRYFEPFVGGGAFFFDLAPRRAVLNDMNVRLMRTYMAIRDDVDMVIKLLSSWTQYVGDREFFERLRARDIDDATNSTIAAWMIFLNKTAFNGLYHVNARGQFNVPFGKYKMPPRVCDVDGLRAASKALTRVHLRHGDFRFACQSAAAGDLVYFDPPYAPTSDTASFTSYTPGGFVWAHHIALHDLALDLKRRGVHVILSNAGLPEVRELYSGPAFTIHEVTAQRAINSKATARGPVSEFIIT